MTQNEVAALLPYLTAGERARLDRILLEPYPALHDFVVAAWPLVEPGRTFHDNWHIGAICEHLEACTDGEIRNLIVNLPPRCMKSLLISVFWFAWVWTFRPESRWIYSSYADMLSTRDSLKCRRIIQSPWYQGVYGGRFRLTGDQNAKTRFENDRAGFRIATTVAGANTGEGGDFVIVDDPHKVLEAESEAERETVRDWWFESMPTRFNDPTTVVKVIVMQRVHDADLTGEVLARDMGYQHLCLPMRYEPERVISYGAARGRDSIMPTRLQHERPELRDPRSTEGELLWPARLPESEVVELEKSLLAYGTAGQLQQRPAPRGGGMLQRGWFKIVPVAPVDARRVRYWDKAGTEGGEGAQTAGVLVSRTQAGRFCIEDVITGRWSSGQREAVILQTAQADAARYGRGVEVWVEQEPGSGGKESAEATIRNLAGYNVHAERVTGDKVTRATPMAAQAEAGNVDMLEAEWNARALAQMEGFPNGKLKDIVDAAGGAVNKLALTRSRQFMSW